MSHVDAHRAQIAAILTAWGMPEHNASRTADVLSWADLHGIDSHGISMMTEYDVWRRAGRINLHANPAIVTQTPVSALIDGGGGLGHVPACFGMEVAIGKAREHGVGMVAVRNSAHFGACGYFVKRAADAGYIGYIATSASGIRVAPTGGAQARLGTDPFAFAAPSLDDRPFLLDMATTTVAAGKIRNRANEGRPCPQGWVLDSEGRSSRDPNDMLQRGGFMTSLGGSAEGSSYKGYGLAAMVNILSSCLSGATLVTDPLHTKKPQGMDIGHFILVLDPGLFRDAAAFRADVSSFCATLRATRPADPAVPVQVAGDPERAHAARRLAGGIPIEPGLRARLQRLASEAQVPWRLAETDRPAGNTTQSV